MKVKNDWWLYAVIAAVLLALAIGVLSGCDEPLRFAPSQAIKQNAELTHELAVKVNEEGTDPSSPASKKLEKGTSSSLTYIGRPTVAVDVSEFDTINAQASADAEQRPDTGGMVDSALELGIGIFALLGGGLGVKGVQALSTVRAKAKGFEELVRANDLFKEKADGQVNGAFKSAHNEVQSTQTRKLVASTRIS